MHVGGKFPFWFFIWLDTQEMPANDDDFRWTIFKEIQQFPLSKDNFFNFCPLNWTIYWLQRRRAKQTFHKARKSINSGKLICRQVKDTKNRCKNVFCKAFRKYSRQVSAEKSARKQLSKLISSFISRLTILCWTIFSSFLKYI